MWVQRVRILAIEHVRRRSKRKATIEFVTRAVGKFGSRCEDSEFMPNMECVNEAAILLLRDYGKQIKKRLRWYHAILWFKHYLALCEFVSITNDL